MGALRTRHHLSLRASVRSRQSSPVAGGWTGSGKRVHAVDAVSREESRLLDERAVVARNRETLGDHAGSIDFARPAGTPRPAGGQQGLFSPGIAAGQIRHFSVFQDCGGPNVASSLGLTGLLQTPRAQGCGCWVSRRRPRRPVGEQAIPAPCGAPIRRALARLAI
jgi:hypothetical protein